ncbi:MAG: hypothetical protein ABR961_12580 [Thermoanaerobaculaceae bacterium]|jgi:hypothetical protein
MTKALIVTVCIALAAGTALATVPVTDQYLPALGHANGAAVNGVLPAWRGDVWIFNPSATQSATVTIYLLLRAANPNPTSLVQVVAPGDTIYLPDVIFNTFGQNNLYAGLRFLSTIPVLVTAESYVANVVTSLGTGTSGQFFSGIPASWALGLNDSTDMPGFDQDGTGTTGRFRSNLAVVETTGNPVNYNVQIYDGSNNLIGTKAYSLDVRQVGQTNTVITDVTGGTGTNERVHIVVTGGTGQLIAVGSRIDNTTGDPSTIDMESIHNWGVFDGVVFDAAIGTGVDGGIELQISDQVLTNYDALGDLCTATDSPATGDVSPDNGNSNVPIANGTFTTTVSISYGGGIFTTVWTLTGTRGADGIWTGTLSGNTTGGTGANAGCNGVSTQNWRAAWTATGS